MVSRKALHLVTLRTVTLSFLHLFGTFWMSHDVTTIFWPTTKVSSPRRAGPGGIQGEQV